MTLPLNSPADKLNCLSHLLVDGYQLSCSCIPSRNLTREYSWWIFCHILCRCSRCCLGMVHMWERGMTLSYSFSGIPGMYGVPSTNRTTLQTQTPLSSYCTLMKHNTNAIHNMTSASQEEKKRGGETKKENSFMHEREREQLNILFSCFSLPTQTTQSSFTGENGSSPWSWLSGTSWTYRKAD